jgi:hypothetical protein
LLSFSPKMMKTVSVLSVLASTDALKCLEYGPISTGLVKSVSSPFVKCDLIGNNASITGLGDIPCESDCTSEQTFCYNSYKESTKTQVGGCTTACEQGITSDGTGQSCCTTDNCNTDIKTSDATTAKATISLGLTAAIALYMSKN